MSWKKHDSLVSLLLLMLGSFPGHAQEIFREQRVAPSEFVVMSWGPTPPDSRQVEWMKEAGINVAGFVGVKDLLVFERAGVQVFVSDPRINNYDFEKPLDEGLLRRNVQAVAKEVGNSPAVIGFLLRDEPHAKAIPSLGLVSKLIRETMPGKLPYVNLFPSRVSIDRMGSTSYEEYVGLLINMIKQPFLSYDNYSLVSDDMNDDFFTNLEKIRRLSVESGVPFWNCVLSNAHFNYMENSDATYHLQAYSIMAHGGRGIQYFSYFTWALGNYRMGPIDQFGNKTASWEVLRRINNQIHVLAPTLKNLKSTGVYHYPKVPPECKPLSDSRLLKSVAMTQSHLVTVAAQGRFLAGEYLDERGRPYFMLVNKDLKNSFRFEVTLRNPGAKLVHISPYSGKEEEFRQEMDWIGPGGGHLFRVE